MTNEEILRHLTNWDAEYQSFRAMREVITGCVETIKQAEVASFELAQVIADLDAQQADFDRLTERFDTLADRYKVREGELETAYRQREQDFAVRMQAQKQTLEGLRNEICDAERELRDLESIYAEQELQYEAAHEHAMQERQTEVEALELRKSELEQAIATLKERFA